MDISKTYQGMCDCPEIQEQQPYAKDAVNSFFYRKEMRYIESETIWLPRQDQIQEIFADADGCSLTEIAEWCRWIAYNADKPEPHYNDVFDTGEQLWLAYYMYEKHSKFWDGEKWVKKE